MDTVWTAVAMIALATVYIGAIAFTMTIAGSWRSELAYARDRAARAEKERAVDATDNAFLLSESVSRRIAEERECASAVLKQERASARAMEDVEAAFARLKRTTDNVSLAAQQQSADATRISNSAHMIRSAADASWKNSQARAAQINDGIDFLEGQLTQMSKGSLTKAEMNEYVDRIGEGLARATEASDRSVLQYRERVDELLRAAETADAKAAEKMSSNYTTRAELAALVKMTEEKMARAGTERTTLLESAEKTAAQGAASCAEKAATLSADLTTCEKTISNSLSSLDQGYLEDLTSLHSKMISELGALKTKLDDQNRQTADAVTSVAAAIEADSILYREYVTRADVTRDAVEAYLKSVIEDRIPLLAEKSQTAELAKMLVGDPAEGGGISAQVEALSRDLAETRKSVAAAGDP